MALILIAAAVPRRVMPSAAAVIAGSVLGCCSTPGWWPRVLLAGAADHPRMAARAFAQFAEGPSAMMHQALSGIPVKVYARAAGEHGIALWNLAGWTCWSAGCVFRLWALVFGVSRVLHPWLRRHYGAYLVGASVLFTAGLSAVITAWS